VDGLIIWKKFGEEGPDGKGWCTRDQSFREGLRGDLHGKRRRVGQGRRREGAVVKTVIGGKRGPDRICKAEYLGESTLAPGNEGAALIRYREATVPKLPFRKGGIAILRKNPQRKSALDGVMRLVRL